MQLHSMQPFSMRRRRTGLLDVFRIVCGLRSSGSRAAASAHDLARCSNSDNGSHYLVWRPATCTCTYANAACCRTHSPRSGSASRSRELAMICIPVGNGICVAVKRLNAFTLLNCSPNQFALPSAATFHSTACATSIRKKSFLPVRRLHNTCDSWSKQGWHGDFRPESQPKSAR